MTWQRDRSSGRLTDFELSKSRPLTEVLHKVEPAAFRDDMIRTSEDLLAQFPQAPMLRRFKPPTRWRWARRVQKHSPWQRKRLGPHVCESNREKIKVWIAKDALGEIRSGCDSGDGCSAVSILTPAGWYRLGGNLNIHVSQDQYSEAVGEICVRAHDARLMHCSVDDRDPWPDAGGPWRLEIPLAVLESSS